MPLATLILSAGNIFHTYLAVICENGIKKRQSSVATSRGFMRGRMQRFRTCKTDVMWQVHWVSCDRCHVTPKGVLPWTTARPRLAAASRSDAKVKCGKHFRQDKMYVYLSQNWSLRPAAAAELNFLDFAREWRGAKSLFLSKSDLLSQFVCSVE